ncbi:hypothetical protein ETAA8_30190 [Anatilimnocola aggregata]|uniref:Uncharacterized protein n=1 Tax=Anatilimnocola aggregata TaxID=2528021 RepID=A0A517YCH1_9BACT|nr:hypothetical protein [Anatilimnocola aggregata]QDU27928.1 hypothetical protein ETAA8_30190 [Anatilimnocola aggregata]
MTRLSTLRTQLSSLRRARSLVRVATAGAALVIAALWALVAVLVLDLLFELPAPQRLVVMAIAIGAVVWAAIKFTWPLLQQHESVEDMALLVERQQKIDSDLIAALQFESTQAGTWGSQQLEGAVIDYVAHVGNQLNVFEGFSRTQMIRRAALLAVTGVVLIAAAIVYPHYAGAFFNRLLLGGRHYPTATTIERIVINQKKVLEENVEGCAPQSMKAAQGRPLEFAVFTRGHKPEAAALTLTATGVTRTRTQLDLKPATREERLNRLRRAAEMMEAAAKNDEIDISQPWREQVALLLAFDADEHSAQVLKTEQRSSLAELASQVAAQLKSDGAIQEHKSLFLVQQPRLLESVRYSLVAGDAWTDPATISMIPLPAVEPSLKIVPPAYAQQEAVPDAGQRQVALLSGSSLEIALDCTNGKRLQSAWINLRQRETTERLDLAVQDRHGTKWALVDLQGHTPLKNIREEFRYELQVIDEDGLSLEMPIRGSVRIKPDRPPTAAADVVHKVVLPTAEPVVHYRAADDYGIASLKLIAEVERRTDDNVAAAAPEESAQTTGTAEATTAVEKKEFPLLTTSEPLRAGKLPLDASFALPLSSLALNKGDRVKITLEVVDYRGDNEAGQPAGERYQSDPLVLEISDESGVLAAISEADQRSEQRLTDIIKRQLGIGESP